jgi:hypothetical protein
MSDDARDRLDLLVDTDPLRLRDEAYSLLARAEQAEAERDALAAQVAAMTGMLERMPEVHMQFGLLHPDGTTEQLPCADWCYACKLQTAIERADRAEATVREQVVAELTRAAQGRAHYAGHAPADAVRAVLEIEAATYATAARIATGAKPLLMLGLLPLVMWSEAEEALVAELTRGENR